jgi:addiction module RelB/DinJ family antitoxin
MLSIKLDKSLKTEAQELAQRLGVSLNAVINSYIKQFISEEKVTFSDHPVLNKRAQKHLSKLIADAKAGKNMVGPFSTAEEMIASLKS